MSTASVVQLPAGRPPAGGREGSPRSAAAVAGVSLLLMAALAGFANFAVLEGLVTAGDATRTAAAIRASEGLWRLGVAALLLVVVLDVLVAWALLQLLTPVSRSLSILAAWFRLAYSAVFLMAIANLMTVPPLLADAPGVSTSEQDGQALQQIGQFHDVWEAGLLLFGVHLLLVGYLSYRSGVVPRVLGALVAVAGGGYVFDTLAAVLGSTVVVSTVTFVGELLLAIWLVLRGRRVR